MVEVNLTKEIIEDGAKLVEALDSQGLSPDAAFWLYSPESQMWKLAIAQVEVGRAGPRQIYQKVQETLSGSPQIKTIKLDDVSILRTDAPIVALLRLVLRTGHSINGIRLKNNVINGTLVEDAYIYRIN